MHEHRTFPGVDPRFWIGAAWSIAFSAALIALAVGAWRLAFA